MPKVIYYSMTGNTEAMANEVLRGINEAGGSGELCTFDSLTPSDLSGEPSFALGCPAMGAEVLEEAVVEPFMTELEGQLSGKKVLLFGSFGWGDGEWMRNWVERCQAAGAEVVDSIICNGYPDDETSAKLAEAGKKLV